MSSVGLEKGSEGGRGGRGRIRHESGTHRKESEEREKGEEEGGRRGTEGVKVEK